MAVVDNLEALLAKDTDNASLCWAGCGQLEQAIGHLRKALADTGRTDEARGLREWRQSRRGNACF